MTLIDSRGRLFGRINLVDAALAGFVIVLIPVAYGTYLLFRTPKPTIATVRRVEITREERRVGGPGLTAKFKVQGSGLRPLLRAFVDDMPAIGFVFENPGSADVLVGAVPPGAHDLILYDGVQEVARAARAVTIQPTASARVRLVGTVIGLDKATADSLAAGHNGIVQLGAARPDVRRVRVGSSEVELPVQGGWARDAAIDVRCDPDPGAGECTIGGRTLSTPAPVVTIAGPAAPLSLVVTEVLPDARPRQALADVRFAGNPELLDLMTRGDRDLILDGRAATIAELGRRQGGGGTATIDATLRLGADAVQDGWNYRGRALSPGENFTLTTGRYIVTGSILRVSLGETAARPETR